jgi:hypothetical protein
LKNRSPASRQARNNLPITSAAMGGVMNVGRTGYRCQVRTAVTGAFLAGVLQAGTVAAAPQVEVRFVEPARYADAAPGKYGYARERDAALADLRVHLIALGQRHLRPDDELTIDVLDVDLAGHFEPWRPMGYDARILRDITWPRIKMKTVLVRDGQRFEREEQVADLNYLLNATVCRSQQPLCYEKRMLDAWFEKRFGDKAAAAQSLRPAAAD